MNYYYLIDFFIGSEDGFGMPFILKGPEINLKEAYEKFREEKIGKRPKWILPFVKGNEEAYNKYETDRKAFIEKEQNFHPSEFVDHLIKNGYVKVEYSFLML